MPKPQRTNYLKLSAQVRRMFPDASDTLDALNLSRVAWMKQKQMKRQVEARGFEPLTSGLQSPRSAKLSYAPENLSRRRSAKKVVAGAGFEPATFGL